MAIYRLGDATPVIPESAYVATEATVVGRVMLGERSSLWPGVVIRGDDDTITIGDDTNVQDGTVLHADLDCPLRLGVGVTVGHQAMLHGCTIGDNSLIGMQAIVLNRAVIGRDSLVAAGAVVTSGKVFPDRSMIVGTPAKVLRELTDDEVASLRKSAASYVKRAATYKSQLQRVD